jgi:hypothetical protein
MKKITLFGLSILIIGGAISCKKYDDGPAFSLRSKKARAVAEWNVKSYTVDGENMLYQAEPGSMTCSSGGTVQYAEANEVQIIMELRDNGGVTTTVSSTERTLNASSTFNDCNAVYETQTQSETTVGVWEFISDKERIQIFMEGDVEIYDIKELKEKRMKLQGVINGELHVLELEKR